MPTKAEQLEWESRAGKLAAVAAFATIILSVGSNVYVSSALDSTPESGSARELLEVREAQPEVFLTGAVLAAIGSLLMIAVLLYLYRAVKLRRPELPVAVLPLAILGPVLIAAAGILVQLDFTDIAREFVASGPRKEARAEDLVADRSVLAQSVGLSGALALAFATILLSQSAMRAGLVTRFLGILGIVVGAIYVLGTLFPLGTDLIQLFWLLALGLIFMDKWPGGRGPAWATGEAIEWPSAAQRRAELPAAEDHGAEPVAAGAGSADGPTRTRTSRKRKKKRR
jgi:hypothetical protein